MSKKSVTTATVSILLAMLLGAALVVSCAQPATAPTSKAWPKTMSLGTASAGTGAYNIGVQWAKFVGDKIGIDIGAEVTSGGSVANARLLHSGDIQLGYVTTFAAYQAPRGTEDFKDIGKVAIRTIFQINGALYYIVTRAEDNIRTPLDLKGKRLRFNYPKTPPIDESGKSILQAYGIALNQVTLQTLTGAPDVFGSLVDRTSDAANWLMTEHPHGATMEGAQRIKAFFIPVDKDVIASKITPKSPWISYGDIPAGVYPGCDKDTTTLSGIQYYFARADLPDDLVYAIVKATFADTASLAKFNVTFKQWTKENAVSYMLAPYHPGAIKYFKEVGVWGTKEESRNQELLKEIGATK